MSFHVHNQKVLYFFLCAENAHIPAIRGFLFLYLHNLDGVILLLQLQVRLEVFREFFSVMKLAKVSPTSSIVILKGL